MKKILISIMTVAGFLGFVGCEKVNPTPEAPQGHDIFYTVSEGAAVPGFSGTTVHLGTESEFDALLDRFCSYAQNGDQVMFCGSRTSSSTKDAGTNTPTTISTSSRDELKTWMKEMEKAGKTVRITYDNGTWNGTAYLNLGQDDMQQLQNYTGSLVYVPAPVLEEPPMGGVVWAMQVGADSTLIITVHGMLMWFDSIDDNMRLIEGATVSLEGVVGTHTDLENNQFMTIGLNVEEEK